MADIWYYKFANQYNHIYDYSANRKDSALSTLAFYMKLIGSQYEIDLLPFLKDNDKREACEHYAYLMGAVLFRDKPTRPLHGTDQLIQVMLSLIDHQYRLTNIADGYRLVYQLACQRVLYAANFYCIAIG